MSKIIWVFLPIIALGFFLCEIAVPILCNYEENEQTDTIEARLWWSAFIGGMTLGVIGLMEIYTRVAKRCETDFK